MKDQMFGYSPMMFPPWWGPPQQQPRNEAPVRVQVAMEFLQGLTMKTMNRGVPSDVAPLEIEGQKLLPVEHETQAAALNMLTAYFKGTLVPSQMELEAKKEAESPIQIVPCPQCGGDKKKSFNCGYCQQRGAIAVQRTDL